MLASPPPRAARPGPTDRRITVLVASPDAVYADSVASCLARDGMAATTCQHAADLSPATLAGADVLVVELGGPGWGCDLLERVRDLAPLLEVVAVASAPDVDAAVQALQAGAFSILSYPISSDQLAGEVRLACARKRHGEDRLRQLDEAESRGGAGVTQTGAHNPKGAPHDAS